MLVVRLLIWDSWNVTHLAKHEITPDQVEEMCSGNPIVQTGHSGRLLVFGSIKSGKMITAVLDREEEGIYYPVTARSASRRERAIYRQEKEVKTHD